MFIIYRKDLFYVKYVKQFLYITRFWGYLKIIRTYEYLKALSNPPSSTSFVLSEATNYFKLCMLGEWKSIDTILAVRFHPYINGKI